MDVSEHHRLAALLRNLQDANRFPRIFRACATLLSNFCVGNNLLCQISTNKGSSESLFKNKIYILSKSR